MPDDPVLVAVDFTADRLRVLLADEVGAPLDDASWDLPELPDEDAWSWEVGGRIATMFASEGGQRSALAVAIAAPGTVDPLAGRLTHSDAQPGWDNLPVVELLRRHIDAPIAAESRTVTALLGEQWQGAASEADDVLYVSLRGVPAAALLSAGRPVRGANYGSGALPAVPELDPERDLSDEELESVSGLLADATALLGPAVVVLDAAKSHREALVPFLQRVVDEVAPGPQVVAAKLGMSAAVVGAVRMATTLALEGHRKPR